MPHVTGRDLIAAAKTMLDWDYVVDEFRLTGAHRTTDCSGFIYLSAKKCGLGPIPVVSWTQARWCHEAKTDLVPINTILHVPGGLMFKGDRMGYDGYGPTGHVAFSMGDGVNVIEAEGSKRDVLINPALGEGHPWTNAAYMPGVDYGSGPASTPPPVTEGNPMYAADEFVSVYTDGAGHTWALRRDGSVYTLTGTVFHGSYTGLKDAAGHTLPARDDFGHITRRFDGKPGYSIWPLHYRKGEHYDFPVAK